MFSLRLRRGALGRNLGSCSKYAREFSFFSNIKDGLSRAVGASPSPQEEAKQKRKNAVDEAVNKMLPPNAGFVARTFIKFVANKMVNKVQEGAERSAAEMQTMQTMLEYELNSNDEAVSLLGSNILCNNVLFNQSVVVGTGGRGQERAKQTDVVIEVQGHNTSGQVTATGVQVVHGQDNSESNYLYSIQLQADGRSIRIPIKKHSENGSSDGQNVHGDVIDIDEASSGGSHSTSYRQNSGGNTTRTRKDKPVIIDI